MSCLYASDFSFKNFCKLASINMQKQFEKMLGKKVMTHTRYRVRIVHVFLPQYQRQRKCFFQSASWKRLCVTHWRKQSGIDSYLPRQISKSDCEISSNCGKNLIFWLDKINLPQCLFPVRCINRTPYSFVSSTICLNGERHWGQPERMLERSQLQWDGSRVGEVALCS